MSVVDLQAEREARQTPSTTFQEAIDAIDAQMTVLRDSGDTSPASARDFARLATEKANMLTKLERALAKEKKEELRAALASIPMDDLNNGIKSQIRELLKTKDFHFVEANSRFWLHYPARTENGQALAPLWIPLRKTDLCLHHPDLEPKANNEYWRLFLEVMEEDGRNYRNVVHTFDKVPARTLNLLRHEFIAPKPGTPHFVFDTLLLSLAGGKQENMDHLEKVITAAWNDPAGNYLRPCQVFDDGGSTGKTLFATKVLTTLFGEHLVVPSVDIESLNGFNSHLAGKAVVFINEVSQDKEDSNTLRRVLGSKQIKLEFKGVDATFADNTALYFISGNNMGVGAVKLMNNGVDRRYSMHCPENPLSFYTREILTHDDIAAFKPNRNPADPVTAKEADAWMRRVGQHILSDPEQVAIWLNSLIERHGRVKDVEPLHGADYLKILEGQKGTHEKLFETVFNDPKFTHIRRRTLFQLFKAEEPRSTMRNETFYKLADDWIKKANAPVGIKRGVRWGRTSADLYVSTATAVVHQNDNDDDYYQTNEFGRVTWRVTLP